MPETRGSEIVVASAKAPAVIDRGAALVHAANTGFGRGFELDDDPLSFRQLALAFRRNRWLILGIVVACVAASIVYNRMADRVYRSIATIRIDDRDSRGSILNDLGALTRTNNQRIMTEIEVLRSRRLAESVADRLHLNVEAGRGSVVRRALRVISVSSDLPRARFDLIRKSPNTYSLRAVSNKGRLPAPATITTGVPFTIGPVQLVLDQPSTDRLPEKIYVEFRPLRRAANAVRSALTVSRPNRDAQIIQVRYRSKDSVLAAAVPNLLLDEFIRFKSETNKTEASSTAAFLRQQVASYDAQLRRAEAALGAFREKEKVVSVADEAESQVQRMAALQAERDQLQAERNALAAILAKDSRDGTKRARDIAAFPSFIANRAMQDILQSLIELENSRSQLLVRRNPENADVVALTERIDGLQGQLTQMAKAYLEGVDSKIASLNATFRSFGKEVEAIPAKEIAFARLSREQKLLADLSTLLQTRLKEAEIREAVDVGDARVIDRALVPDFPSSPRLSVNLVVGFLAGLFFGFAAAIARMMMDTRVRTNEDVQHATAHLPVLAAIPRIRAVAAANGVSPTLITSGNSRQPFAEAYRALRTNITFAAADRFHQALVITSASASDGKSTTAANLAVTLAQQGVRTVLIDADLRKGVLHRLFSKSREPGLTELILGKAPLNNAVQKVSIGDDQTLYVIPSGTLPPNPAELIGSDRMRKLLDELRQEYEMIVFDTPPLTMVTDAAILGTLVDSTMLVARAGVTDKRALQHAAAQLTHLGVNVSGTILNDFNPRSAGYEYGYGYVSGYA